MTDNTEQSVCWCGDGQFVHFSAQYQRCTNCGTLVSQVGLSSEQLTVRDDSTDFYGRSYYESHLTEDYGYPDFMVRTRCDLSERCLHWLRTVLKYKLPSANVLELGSAHGGFVALLQWVGFQATGLELSPWVVEFARTTFDIPMLLGPVEGQQIEPGTLDVIALMDVLEHLPDPVGTMRYCLNLLKPDGVLVIQTPCYPEGKTYDAMVAASAPFLEQLKSNEHLYLFGQSSIRELFHRLEAEHLVFEPAIFAHYDMFCVVSRQALQANSTEAVEQVLRQATSGRLVQALLDADDRRIESEHKLALAEAERNVLQAELNALREHYANSEADRAKRLEVIQAQGQQLGVVEAERNVLQAELSALREHYANSEADRAKRLEVIQAQGQQLGILAAEVVDLRERGEQVSWQLRNAETQLRKQQQLLQAIQSGRVYRVLRQFGQWQWFDAGLADIASYTPHTHTEIPTDTLLFGQPLSVYRATIDGFNAGQPNKDLLDRIRAYNHQMVDEFNKVRPIRRSLLLDIGASPHGYALERVLEHGATLYVGVGLDVDSPHYVVGDYGGTGITLKMDATALQFPANMFDAVLSISTFEHVSNAELVLSEIARVLKPGGQALISFEPIWSCSYGHHLHHFGECSAVVPPWAHLLWTAEQMREALADKWPANGSLTLDQAIEWVYYSDAINRVEIRQFCDLFQTGPLKVEWIVELKEPNLDPAAAQHASQVTGFSTDELTTKGLSVLLVKESH